MLARALSTTSDRGLLVFTAALLLVSLAAVTVAAYDSVLRWYPFRALSLVLSAGVAQSVASGVGVMAGLHQTYSRWEVWIGLAVLVVAGGLVLGREKRFGEMENLTLSGRVLLVALCIGQVSASLGLLFQVFGAID
jgi:hypothetical protein